MKEEKKMLDMLSQIDDKYIEECAPLDKPVISKRSSIQKHIIKYSAVAACAAIAIISIISLNARKNLITLSSASKNVTVKYTDTAVGSSTQADLIWLSEDEIFNKYDTVVFKGTIISVDNIICDYNGNKDYRAISRIEVTEVYRGSMKVGDILTLLLPCPISGDMWVEDSEVITDMIAGMSGIFMPVAYDSSSVRSENGATLALQDLAGYGLYDERFIFLDTDNGPDYASWAYESISGITAFNEIEEYVKMMVQK